jgi:hypothetical protein
MSKLKLSGMQDDTPVRLSIELPAHVHRDLLAYAGVLAKEDGGKVVEPAKLVTPMLIRFMATDRVFAKLRSGAAASPSPASTARA